jgi:hypothetical protein
MYITENWKFGDLSIKKFVTFDEWRVAKLCTEKSLYSIGNPFLTCIHLAALD